MTEDLDLYFDSVFRLEGGLRFYADVWTFDAAGYMVKGYFTSERIIGRGKVQTLVFPPTRVEYIELLDEPVVEGTATEEANHG